MMPHARRHNRRGSIATDLFLLGFCVFFLIEIIFIFGEVAGAFQHQNPNEGLGTRQMGTLSTYAVTDQMLLYLDTAARFAAYQSLDTITDKGGINPVQSQCGTYASYQRWSAPPDKRCFPKEQELTAALGKDFLVNLHQLLQYPGFPNTITYRITTTTANGVLRITGTTDEQVTLPIIAGKDVTQETIESLIRQKNLGQASGVLTVPDAKVPGIVVKQSPNAKPRTHQVTYVIIGSTQTDDAATALYQYTQGSASVHYMIDRDGSITQVVPEQQRASSLASCAPGTDTAKYCAIPDIEDRSISVFLVGPGPQQQTIGVCPGKTTAATATNWCVAPYKPEKFSCPKKDATTQQCWTEYAAQQAAALKALVADIVHNNQIPPQNVLLAEQADMMSSSPGPMLKKALGDITYDTFIAQITELANKQAAQPSPSASLQAPAATPAQQIPTSQDAIGWPAQSREITSCFGQRTANLHYGTDIGMPVGSDVRAAADGTVGEVCDEWTGACHCSSATDDSCKARCASRCGNYGNKIVLLHDSGTASQYNHLDDILVVKGQHVTKGTLIAHSGNTGNSRGPHLDFMIYPTHDIIKTSSQNALCYYPESELAQLDQKANDNCVRYTTPTVPTFSHTNPKFENECKGITAMTSSNDCGINNAPISAGGNKDVDTTIQNINAQHDDKGTPLLTAIQDAAKAQGVDARLVLSIITAESKGLPNLVSPTGCAGLGQFCMSTATGGEFRAIFGDGVKRCACPGKGSCTAAQANCEGDPRFDAFKSAKAIPVLLRSDYKSFDGKRDQALFTIAAYNIGGGTVRDAIKKTGKTDPAWDEVSAAFDDAIIVRDLCGGDCSQPKYAQYFGTPEQRAGKIREVQGYVRSVGGYYISLGGSTQSALSDTQCGGMTVKELGRYSFTPSFTVEIPDTIALMNSVSRFAQETYAKCDGRDGKDNDQCLADQKTAFNSKTSGVKIIDCSDADGQQAILNSLEQAQSDCAANRQDACTCAWKPPTADDMTARLFSDTAQIIIGNTPINDQPTSDPTVLYASTPESAPSPQAVTLSVEKGLRRVTVWTGDPSEEGKPAEFFAHVQTMATLPQGQDFTMFKHGNDVVWTADPQGMQACGMYSVEHHVCARLATPTYDIGTGATTTPDIKFSLYLRDTTPPDAIKSLRAAKSQATVSGMLGDYIGVAFSPSPSADISYYRVTCAAAGNAAPKDAGKNPKQQYTIVQGIENGKPITLVQNLGTALPTTMCSGGVGAAQYTVTVIPYDKSGNAGTATSATTQSDSDTGYAGLIAKFASGQSLTTQDLVNAVVTYYAGSAAGAAAADATAKH